MKTTTLKGRTMSRQFSREIFAEDMGSMTARGYRVADAAAVVYLEACAEPVALELYGTSKAVLHEDRTLERLARMVFGTARARGTWFTASEATAARSVLVERFDYC